jgi:small subunit ribosomal protein S15
MALTNDKKQEIVGSHRRHDADTGSAEVQIALLTERISQLTGHLKTHSKDHSSRRGLLKMVGKRSGLLKFLQRRNRDAYLATIGKLGLRK